MICFKINEMLRTRIIYKDVRKNGFILKQTYDSGMTWLRRGIYETGIKKLSRHLEEFPMLHRT